MEPLSFSLSSSTYSHLVRQLLAGGNFYVDSVMSSVVAAVAEEGEAAISCLSLSMTMLRLGIQMDLQEEEEEACEVPLA